MRPFANLAARLPAATLLSPLMLVATSCSRPSLYKNNGAVSISALIYYVIAIIAILDIFKQPWGILRKLIWTVVVLVPLGLILYYLVSGRTKQS
ncbi:MAG: hypothetical protein EOO37_00445 [Cytophagaceae bacterium]|nr:MAG: hypothetical protein EOO37_00445 [Cytophagaceae bacterium]